MKNIIEILIAAAIIVGLCFVLLYPPLYLVTEVIGIQMGWSSGGSMEPTFSGVTLSLFRRTDDIKRGDIIVFEAPLHVPIKKS